MTVASLVKIGESLRPVERTCTTRFVHSGAYLLNDLYSVHPSSRPLYTGVKINVPVHGPSLRVTFLTPLITARDQRRQSNARVDGRRSTQ